MLASPLAHLSQLIAANGGKLDQAQEQFQAAVSAAETGTQAIPPLSASSPSGSLVRFRAMVQDNGFSPQIYMADLNIVNVETGEKKTVSCHFGDRVPLVAEPNSKWIVDESANDFMFGKYGQKTPLFCVALPAETTWAAKSNSQAELEQEFAAMNVDEAKQSQNIHVARKVCHPTERPAIVKIYGNEPTELQLGAIVDFVGILELPETAVDEMETAEAPVDTTNNAYLIHDEMEPFEKIPIIHAVFYEPVSPLAHPLQYVSGRDVSAREMTLQYLLPSVLGDTLAAEYLLVHMVTKMRMRTESIQTGNVPMNLSNLPTPAAATTLQHTLESLLPRVRTIPLTVEYLNTKRMAPGVFVSREAWKEMHGRPAETEGGAVVVNEKELAVYGLVSGELMVPDRTCVVVDEVGMDSGVLKEQGVINVRQLNDLITFAELPFAVGGGNDSPDFSAGKLLVDFGVLVLSQAKCMFDIKCVVPVQPAPEHAVPSVENAARVSEEDMNTMRAYLGAVLRCDAYTVSEEMNETLTAFFMTQRKQSQAKGEKLYTQDAFMLRMEIARALTLLAGGDELTMEAWNKSGEMEAERLARVERVGKKGGKGEEEVVQR
ncbi:hypothetical protein HDU98_000088 [Podochytrium sp. JEL0797]|nr:hypothetical protein HDU98_000088 [Podochytrium sp. JEL0797]